MTILRSRFGKGRELALPCLYNLSPFAIAHRTRQSVLHPLPSMDTPSIAHILVSLDGEEIEIAGSMRGLTPLLPAMNLSIQSDSRGTGMFASPMLFEVFATMALAGRDTLREGLSKCVAPGEGHRCK